MKYLDDYCITNRRAVKRINEQGDQRSKTFRVVRFILVVGLLIVALINTPVGWVL